MGLEEAHGLVSLLLTPTDSTPAGRSDKTWLERILAGKVAEYSSKCGLTLSPSKDTYFDYVRCCVNSLLNLRFELTNVATNSGGDESRLEPDTLSIGQQKAVLGLVQMILALGVLPNLQPGLASPPSKRSVFLQSVLAAAPERTILEKYKQLVFTTDSLLELAKHKQLNTLIVTKQLGDILACLIQISKAPLSKPQVSRESSPSQVTDKVAELELKEDKFVMTEELYERLSDDQERFGVQLSNIMEQTYQPLIVRSLLVLLSQSEAKEGGARPPKWFTRTLQALLSSRLVLENGVKSVVRGVMDLGGEGGSFDWTKVNMMAAVLGSPPQGKYADTERYYSQICPQLLELMASEDNTVSLIACTSIKSVVERYLILSRRYLLDPLLGPFLKLTESYESALSVTETELDDGIKNLMKVFVLANDPSMMFVTHLEPIILVLLNLHMSITFGVSHLKGPVKQLIDRYLRYSDKATTLKVLRAFALNECPDTTQSRVKLMQRDVMFASGEEGGVKVIQKTDSQQSFYVTDDEAAIAIQDLLEEQKDKALASQFFLCMMEDLTVMVEDNKDGFDVELPSPGDGDVEKQIHDLENHLDAVMHRMRKNLMILRLLSLLSEDKSIEKNLLAESDKMIQFVSVTVRRAAASVRAGVQHSNLATQSLNMSLSILTVHLTKADLPSEDWVKMIDIMEDLDTLSDHEDERISQIAGQLHQLVATQKIVIDEIANLKEKTVQIQEESKKIKERVEEIKQIKVTEENKAMDERKAQLKQKAEELKKQKELRKNKVKTKYEEALFNIGDPLLPVQGHGLIQLTRLVEEKDEETLEKIDAVRLVFQSNLADEDTYIYLNSISGLVVCARYRSDIVLEVLTKEFSMVQSRKQMGEVDSEEEKMTVRTKIGEALVKITKDLGELTPKYKNLLLNSFLSTANDPDPLVRASGLSNLGEVCTNLRFSLGSITGELLQHLSACSRDREPQVRAAAVMVLTMTLQGLGTEVFTVLQGTVREIYRELKFLAQTEKEDVVLAHVSLALKEIDNIVKQLFTPDSSIDNSIVVLK